ncbi:DUF1351 domain-containing protein [uncultured Eubacterium sp.]|uniref:DUF1351 domain-containing protein n=1 Tax=uncultured Eubacterium sp. TaxID=165185 RepID=UPI0032637992
MELQIYNPTDENAIKKIDWNYEELKQKITTRANDYKTLVYTDDNIKDAKSDRANLNKFIKVLDTKRKDVKKMMLEPYTEFESQVKELIGIIGEANNNIDSQVKAYEQKKRDEKLVKVQEIYDGIFGESDLLSILTWDRVFKPTYLNATTTLKSIKTEMTELLERVTNELNIIDNDNGEYQFEMKEAYLKDFNMAEALTVKQRFEENARRKAEYEAKRQAELEARREREKAEAEKIANAGNLHIPKEAEAEHVKAVAYDTAQSIGIEDVKEEVIELAFRVRATASQLEGLKNYLKSNNIEFGPVK